MNEVPEVDATHAARLADADDVLLLDVREDDEWARGRAPQARHLVLADLDPASVPRDRPVIVVCRSGRRSAQATQALLAGGLEARNLTGGMQAWAAAGLPVVAEDGGPGEII